MPGPETWKMVLAKEEPTAATNLVANPEFTTNASSWDTTGSLLVSSPTVARATASWTGHSTGYGRVTASAAAGTSTRELGVRTAEMTVTPGNTMFAEASIKPVLWPTDAPLATGFRVEIQYFSKSGSTTVLSKSKTDTLVDFDANGEVVASLISTVPAGATIARMRIVLNANGFASGSLEFLLDDVKFYTQQALTWTAVNVGELQNASERRFSFKLNQPQTISFTLPLQDPMAAEIITAVGSAVGMPIIKLYRNTTLKMVAEVSTTEIVSASPTTTIRVVAVETMWNRLNKRTLPSSRTRTGFTISTPTERGSVIRDQLNSINNESPSGIEPGVAITSSDPTVFTTEPATGAASSGPGFGVDSASNAATMITGGPWTFRPFMEWLQELAFTLNGFDFWQEPVDPVTEGGVSGSLNLADIRGTAKPEAIFEFGTGRANLVEYSYSLAGDTLINVGIGLPPSFPAGNVALATDWASLAAFRRREELISSELVSLELRKLLVTEHVNIRKQYRRIFTFVPQIEDGTRTPRFGVDYDIGDYIEGRVRDDNILLLAGAVRVYGADIEVSNEGQVKTTLTLVQEV